MSIQPSRRDLLRYAAVAASAASYSRILGANDVIGIGVIGLGNISRGHLEEYGERPETRVTAVCDIYEPRKQAAKEKSGCDLHHDYRKLLDRDDIHGVIIATPDHWHAKMTLDAMKSHNQF